MQQTYNAKGSTTKDLLPTPLKERCTRLVCIFLEWKTRLLCTEGSVRAAFKEPFDRDGILSYKVIRLCDLRSVTRCSWGEVKQLCVTPWHSHVEVWLCRTDGILIATKIVFYQELSALCIINIVAGTLSSSCWFYSSHKIKSRPSCHFTTENCSLSHNQNKLWCCIEDSTKIDLITMDNRVSADWDWMGRWGESPKESQGRGFFFYYYSLSVFSFSSWAPSWLKLSMRVKGPPMTWSTPRMWRRAVTNTRPCARFVRATPNNVLMNLSPCETGCCKISLDDGIRCLGEILEV